MKRRLFTVFAAMSLLLFIAVVVLWVRSFYSLDGLWFKYHRAASGNVELSTFHFVTSRGVAEFFCASGATTDTSVIPVRAWTFGSTPDGQLMFSGSFQWSREVYPRGVVDGQRVGWQLARTIDLPLWIPVALFAVLPLWWAISCRRRARPGMCIHCGYDLRATPDRCPECGSVPAARA